MSAAPPQMRRIPDEQFFDLRSWSADKAEDYGEKASMMVHTILLSKSEQVNRITSELHDGNIILIDFTPLTSDQETLHKILTELEAMLIARAFPKISAWNVSELAGIRGLQRKFKGHVITMKSDIRLLAKNLPRLPSEVKFIVVRTPKQQIQHERSSILNHKS